MSKIAVDDYHVLEILFFRQLIIFLSCLPSLQKAPLNSLKTQRPKMHLLRLFGAFLALSCGIWAVSVLPLTTAFNPRLCLGVFCGYFCLYFLAHMDCMAKNFYHAMYALLQT